MYVYEPKYFSLNLIDFFNASEVVMAYIMIQSLVFEDDVLVMLVGTQSNYYEI